MILGSQSEQDAGCRVRPESIQGSDLTQTNRAIRSLGVYDLVAYSSRKGKTTAIIHCRARYAFRLCPQRRVEYECVAHSKQRLISADLYTLFYILTLL